MASSLCQKLLLKKKNFFWCWFFCFVLFCFLFTSMCYKYFLRNAWRDFRLPMSALATVARKKFNGKFTAKNWFSDRALYLIADANIGSVKSRHALFDKYLDHMLVKFEQNCMIRTIQNFVLFDKNCLTIFDKVLTPFWKTFLWLKSFVWC